MNILLDIQYKMENLSSSEQKIAQYILEKPSDIIFLSTQKIAGLTGVSPATVVRFAKSLGLSGVPELKQQLSVWKANANSESDFRELMPNEPLSSIKDKLKARMVHMTDMVNNSLKEVDIDESIQHIDESQVVIIFGIGASYLVAQDLAQKLKRIGKTALAENSSHEAAVMLANNPQKMLLIAISDRGHSKVVQDVMALAAAENIYRIAITGHSESPVGQAADLVLISAAGENFKFRQAATVTMMAQHYLVDILYYAYVSSHYADAEGAILKTAHAVKTIEKNNKLLP